MFRFIGLVLAFIACAAPAHGQFFIDRDIHDWRPQMYEHMGHAGYGAALDLVIRPIPFFGWRKTLVGRVASVAVVATGYEVVQWDADRSLGCFAAGCGFSVPDIAYAVGGALVVEGITAAIRKIF